ncbi:MAG TPA: polynucleotide adenylyltransferase PcnB [Xanthomonadales bacterium]|nr:polynucleotide adenylyltransferase PcnB [Xanthomonadales bacterium]
MPANEPQAPVRVPHQPVTLRVVPREQHGISRRNISPNALRVLYRLRDAGFQAFLVGGAVRDLLLGGHPKDFDVATDATPEQVKQQFRNCRLIGRRFRLAHVVFGPETIEVATFRAHVDDGSGDRHVVDGRIVRDNVYGSIEEDAVRRDFTVNALYYAIEDFSVRDWVGGFADIEHRCLRLIGDAEQRYREDPVRMLRAVRLAAKLGFRIEDSAWEAIARLAPLIAEAAPARLFDELLKLFMSGHAHESFRWLEASGLLHYLLPSTAAVMEGRDGAMPPLIENSLRSTDERLLEGKSVTPAFLLAALLWPAVRARDAQMRAQGADPQLALTKAANQVVQEQTRLIAIPKRFTIPMLEIWALQHRFTQLTRKKVVRLMAHPRFRAAYDFLLLRGEEETVLAETIAWWKDAVEKEPGEAAVALATPVSATPAARKRRRRRRRDGGASPPSEA